MACYEDLRTLCAATAKERDELKRENAELRAICEKQAALNGKIAVLALELDNAKAELELAIEILKQNMECAGCVGLVAEIPECDYECADCNLACRCRDCRDGSRFQWRGLGENDGEHFAS